MILSIPPKTLTATRKESKSECSGQKKIKNRNVVTSPKMFKNKREKGKKIEIPSKTSLTKKITTASTASQE